MPRYILLTTVLLALLLSSCDTTDRVSKLERENQELKAQMSKANAAVEYDLQSKCAKDANQWFRENWPPDKTTIILDHTNHYSRSKNKCFVLVEYHYSLEDGRGSWQNSMSLWDLYENSKFASFGETHMVYLKPEWHTQSTVGTCELLGEKCKTSEQFNNVVGPYLTN